MKILRDPKFYICKTRLAGFSIFEVWED